MALRRGSRNAALLDSEEGQAVTEYILLLLIVLSVYAGVMSGLTKMGLAQRLMAPLSKDFAATYRYGAPDAKGFDDGGPNNHPRVVGGNNFRIFIVDQKH